MVDPCRPIPEPPFQTLAGLSESVLKGLVPNSMTGREQKTIQD